MESRCPEYWNFSIWGARIHPGMMWRRRRQRILHRNSRGLLTSPACGRGRAAGAGAAGQKKQGESKSKTPVLDNFGRDLTKMAEDGKLDPVAWADAKRNVFSLPLLAELIVAGYLEDEPVLFKAAGKRDIEGYADPPVCVIGSTGSRFAMEHLNRRGQNVHCSLAQTVLHFHEAMEIARRKDEDGCIGPCDGYVVMSGRFDGFGIVPHRSSTVLGWASAYKDRSETGSLKIGIAQKQAESLIMRLAPGPRFESKLQAAMSKKAAK